MQTPTTVAALIASTNVTMDYLGVTLTLLADVDAQGRNVLVAYAEVDAGPCRVAEVAGLTGDCPLPIGVEMLMSANGAPWTWPTM